MVILPETTCLLLRKLIGKEAVDIWRQDLGHGTTSLVQYFGKHLYTVHSVTNIRSPANMKYSHEIAYLPISEAKTFILS